MSMTKGEQRQLEWHQREITRLRDRIHEMQAVMDLLAQMIRPEAREALKSLAEAMRHEDQE